MIAARLDKFEVSMEALLKEFKEIRNIYTHEHQDLTKMVQDQESLLKTINKEKAAINLKCKNLENEQQMIHALTSLNVKVDGLNIGGLEHLEAASSRRDLDHDVSSNYLSSVGIEEEKQQQLPNQMESKIKAILSSQPQGLYSDTLEMYQKLYSINLERLIISNEEIVKKKSKIWKDAGILHG